MYKQSAFVIGLLLGTSTAVQLRWDNPVQGPAEGVLFPQTGHAEHHTTYFV